MFSKPTTNTPPQGAAPTPPAAPPTPAPSPAVDSRSAPAPAARAQKLASLIASDMTIEGNVVGGGELQIDGKIKGDVRVERVTIGDAGIVEGGVFAEAVEVRGKVSGSVTAKQVRLYGACHVDGDITHEQLAMETGAFFQGRSLRLQRQPQAPVPAPAPAPRPPETASSASAPTPPRDSVGGLQPKPTSAP